MRNAPAQHARSAIGNRTRGFESLRPVAGFQGKEKRPRDASAELTGGDSTVQRTVENESWAREGPFPGARSAIGNRTRGFESLRPVAGFPGKEKRPRDASAELTGGEVGIRTLDTLVAYTHLAGEHLRPLGHFSLGKWKSYPTSHLGANTSLLIQRNSTPFARSRPSL